ncbi:hypothetical protein NUH30_19195 [Leptospira sp. 85282-16]|uniref:hypothetical protein n=1 Tax=Leptospira sp. 85282-16 TaxID=2971256 RepID=UPI0021C0D042|nr:hypothetical protein [Leptospira sp. 85282-16]MCT8335821.1 hypothetical protein [Leptospira sp. 85282-16]
MFERITIVETENIDPNKPLDIGLIIESMLFYQKTIVVFSTEKAIFQLFHELGLENISKLIEADTLEIMFNESYAVIKSDTDSDKKTYHNIGTFSNNIITKESEIHKACVKYTGREGRGRRVAQALIDQTKSFKHMENFKNIAKEVFLDKQYIHKSYQRILNTYIPNQKIWANTFFEIENQNNGLYLNTNLDFKKINEEIATIGKEKIILGPADILASILEIENDVYKTSTNISDLVSQNTKNNLLTLRLEYLMEKINSSNNEKDNLLKHINKNFKTVRQEYYAGKIDINQIVKAILHSNKFKKMAKFKR